MRIHNLLYTTQDDIKLLVREEGVDPGSDRLLIQVFCGQVDEGYVRQCLDDIREILPLAHIMGTTTAGEICDATVYEKSVVVSIAEFEKTEIKTELFTKEGCADWELGLKAAESLITDRTKALLLFADGSKSNGEEIVKGIQQVNKEVRIVGGRAADYGVFGNTYIFTGQGVTDAGVAVCALDSDDLQVYTDYSLSWRIMGNPMRVDKAEGSRVYLIDNTPVVDLYHKYLGERVSSRLPMSAIFFPLIMQKNGLSIARVPTHKYEDGSMEFIGNLRVGDTVQFAFGNVDMILESSMKLSENLCTVCTEAVYIYSCVGRKAFMQNAVEMEIKPFENVAPTAGFFTNGEFYHSDSCQTHELLNETMTILALSESAEICKTKSPAIEAEASEIAQDQHIEIIQAIANLVDKVSHDLDKTKNHLVESEKMAALGQLVSGVAHELGTPAGNAITASSFMETELMRLMRQLNENSLKKSDLQSYIDSLSESSNVILTNMSRIEELITAFKNLAVNQEYEDRRVFNLSAHMEDVIKGLIYSVKRQGHTIMLEVKENIEVFSYPSAFSQIVVNLVNNALVHAFPDGQQGKIALKMVREDEKLMIDFSDDGVGIDPNMIEKIFEPFYTTNRTVGGTGIGLSLVYNLITQKLGGSIRCHSAIGKGVQYMIEIPCNQ